jgi:hypothetical protein
VSKEISASFQIVSDTLSGSQLREKSGLSGGVTHDRGEPISKRSGSHVYKNAVLRIASALPPTSSVVEHLGHLLSVLQPHASQLASLPDDCLREVWLKISHDQQQLGFEVPAAIICDLAALKVGVVVDTYAGTSG